MAQRSNQFRMAEALAGGDLNARLRALYAESSSWEQVARQLFSAHGIVVTGQTLRRWAADLGIEVAA